MINETSFQNGQSLIEIVLAIGAAAIVLTAIATSVLTSLTAVNQSTDQNLAGQYAQEAMDIVRNLRDVDYADFLTRSGDYCLNENAVVLVRNCIRPNVGHYHRTVTFDQSPGCGSGVTKVTVAVSWQDGKCTDPSEPYCHDVTLSNCFAAPLGT